MIQFRILLLALPLALFSSACSSINLPPADSVSRGKTNEIVSAENQSDEGYALLYELLVKERHVNKVLIVKRQSSQLKAVIQKIARESKRMAAELGPLSRKNPPLNLKTTHLPMAEHHTRELIEKDTGKELLAAKGVEFEFRLLQSQLEGLNYGAHLAETLSKTEKDPERKDFLQRTQTTFTQLREEVYRMMLENYTR